MGILKSYIEQDHTDLNTLKYKDSSTIGNQPIVQKKIPSTLNSSVPSSNELNRRVDDLKRIGLILTQPGGIKYLANETALYTSKTINNSEPGLKGKLKTIGDGLLSTVKVIGSTLAQVPLNGTGTHFVKGFLPKRKYYINQFGRDGSSVRKEDRLNHGNPSLTKSRSVYNTPLDRDLQTYDGINLLEPIIGSENIAAEKAKTPRPLNDLIKFRFTVITPDEEVMLPFRAYLTSMSDSFNSQWSSFKYLGRAEDFHTYQGLDRSINIGFSIAAQTRHEMRPLYQKIVYLASSVAPTYSQATTNGGGGLMRGTFVKMTVGSYVYEMPGFIESINYSWNTDYPWEIALNKSNKDAEGLTPDFDQQELPTVLDCNISFKPIHKFAPQAGLYHYITQGELAEGDKEEKLFFKEKKIVPPPEPKKPTPSVEIGLGSFGEFGTDGGS